MNAVDESIPSFFCALFELSCELVANITAIVIFTPVFIIPGAGIGLLGLWLGNFYLKARLSARREMRYVGILPLMDSQLSEGCSNARSPVLSHLSATIAGMISVRAYGAENVFKQESLDRIDHYTRVARISWDLNRWIGVRMDILGSLFITSLATYLVYGPRKVGASNTGFSLTMALEFTTQILSCVRVYNTVEVQSNRCVRTRVVCC